MLLLFLCLTGCTESSSPEKERLDYGIAAIKKTFSELESSELARFQLRDIALQGGTIVTVITASVANPKALPPILFERGKHPWSISIDYEDGKYIVEAYTDDLENTYYSNTFAIEE